VNLDHIRTSHLPVQINRAPDIDPQHSRQALHQAGMQGERTVFLRPTKAIACGLTTEPPHKLSVPRREQQLACFSRGVLVTPKEGSDIAPEFL
jgi:hypothetical protein